MIDGSGAAAMLRSEEVAPGGIAEGSNTLDTGDMKI